MDPIKARLISKKGGHAQVVVVYVEGSTRWSVTRHVHRKGDKWMGRNPDEAAIAVLDKAEASLRQIERYDTLLKLLAGTLVEVLEEASPNPVFAEADKLAFGLKKLNNEIVESTLMLRCEKALVEGLQAATPREVEFVF